mgnify:CR=1 FL=1
MYQVIYKGATIKSKHMIRIAHIIHTIQVKEFKDTYMDMVEKGKFIKIPPSTADIYKSLVGRRPTKKQLELLKSWYGDERYF